MHWGRKVLGFRNALQDSLRLPRRVLLGVFVLTALHWLLRYSVLYLTLQGLGSTLPWAWTVLVQVLALGAGQLSLLPGGAGSAMLHTADMQEMAQINVPPGETVKFENGEQHVMAMNLADTVKAGGTAEVTVTFVGGDEVKAQAEVREAGDR